MQMRKTNREKGYSREFMRKRLWTNNSMVFLRGLLNMREKQILTSAIEIQQENWG